MLKPSLKAAILIVLLLNTVHAQKSQHDDPKPIDEFGWMVGVDLGSRLDDFAGQLGDERSNKACVAVWGPEGKGSGTANDIGAEIKEYLATIHRINPERVVVINAGRFKNPREIHVALFLISADQDPPAVKRFNRPLKVRAGKFFEEAGWDTISDNSGPEGESPSLGDIGLAAFADALRVQNSWIAYIVASQDMLEAPGTWRRAANSTAEMLAVYGIEPDRIKVIHGKAVKGEGYSQTHQLVGMEFWLLPASAPPPAKDAGDEPTPKSAIQVGPTSLDFPDTEVLDRRVRAFADMLKSNSELTACFVVRPALPKDDRNLAYSNAQLPNIPEIEPLKMADDWRTQLTKQYGIAGNRIVILPAAASDFNDNRIDVWLIPPGAPLPDLNPISEEDGSPN